MLVVEVAAIMVMMVAEDPSDINTDVGGRARIPDTISRMSSVVKGRGEG